MPTALLPPQRILVRGVNWLGDAVMTTPALQRLREAHPRAHLALLTPAKLGGLWLHHPAVDAVIEFESSENVWTIARRLRRQEFDTALLLPNSPRSALEVFWAGIPQRIGYARAWRNWFLTHPLPPRSGEVRMRKRSGAEIRRLVASSAPPATGAIPPSAHHLHQYLNLVAALGANPAPLAPHLAVTDAELAAFRGTHLSSAPPDLRWFGLNPHAEYGPAKRWPQERFVEAALALHRQTGCGWLVFGGPKDVAPATEIWAALQRGGVAHAVNLAGRTTLRDLCAALKLCRVLLTNDSGPMHVAAAVGTPVAALFGSTSPELTGPGFVADRRHAILQSRTVCSPCFLRACPIDFRCMNGITVEHAVSAVLFLLR